MRISKQFYRRSSALVLLLAIVTGSVFPGAAQQKSKSRAPKLSDEQRILHVLNRLGYGARPGDVERVRAIGIEKYINEQLNPDKIADSTAEARVQNLATLNMTTAELYEKFPQPNQLLQQLQRRGELPANVLRTKDGTAEDQMPKDK